MAEVIHRYLRKGEPLPQPTKEQLEREESNAKFALARARKETALADLREAESRKRRGELIEKGTAVRQASFLFVTIRQRLLALPALLARKCVGKSQHEMRMIIDAAIREALTALSDFAPYVSTRRQRRVAK